MNAQLRKVTKKRGRFPDRMPLRKVLCLAMMKASERWTRPVQDWPAALNHFALVFPDRSPACTPGQLHRILSPLIGPTAAHALG